MKAPEESFIVIAGAARDVASEVAKQLARFDRAFRQFKKVKYLIVESDSSDGTAEILRQIQGKRADVKFISHGTLRERMPLRTQRIAYARATALEHCKEDAEFSRADYIAVADWDGINKDLNDQAVRSSWDIPAWDAVSANQPGGYYDIWALRHPKWCPGDCWEEYRSLCTEFGDEVAHQIAIANRRINIPRSHSPITVDSAFGGLAIYRAEAFFSAYYDIPPADSAEVCEHVEFHRHIRQNGGRIIINPAMVNIESIEHLLPLFSAQRLKHALKTCFQRGGRESAVQSTLLALKGEAGA